MGESLVWQPAIYLANKFSLSLSLSLSHMSLTVLTSRTMSNCVETEPESAKQRKWLKWCGNLVLVELAVLVLLLAFLLERNDDEADKDVDHEERDDDDVDEIEDGDDWTMI